MISNPAGNRVGFVLGSFEQSAVEVADLIPGDHRRVARHDLTVNLVQQVQYVSGPRVPGRREMVEP